MTIEYRKAVVLTSVPVTGCYRFNNDFQILPAEERAPKPPYVISHHPLIVEYKFIVDETPRTFFDGKDIPQWVTNNEDASQKLNELLLLISTFSSFRVFVYQNSQSWFIPSKPGGVISEAIWGQQSYYYKDFEDKINSFSDVKFDQITTIDSNKYFNRDGRLTDQKFDLPKNIDALFEKYFSSDDATKKAFLSSASLLSQGIKLWSEHPSLSFASIVSSLETLISFDHKGFEVKRCEECGQERYRVVNKFREFFGKYGSPTTEFKKYALKIYKYRSKILHSGELFLGEIFPRRFGSDDGFNDDDMRRNMVRICRICLTNWLLLRDDATQKIEK